MRVVLHDGTHAFTLVGITGFGESDSLAGATLAGFDLATAQQVLGKAGTVDQISVIADDGVDAERARPRYRGGNAPGRRDAQRRNPSPARARPRCSPAWRSSPRCSWPSPASSLLVGSFVIWNTFNVLVAQRRREVGLLRAVGATKRQVLGGILVESAAIGLLATAVGLLGGIGLAVGIRRLLMLVGVEVPSTTVALEPRTLIAALVVGVGVTMVAAAVRPGQRPGSHPSKRCGMPHPSPTTGALAARWSAVSCSAPAPLASWRARWPAANARSPPWRA